MISLNSVPVILRENPLKDQLSVEHFYEWVFTPTICNGKKFDELGTPLYVYSCKEIDFFTEQFSRLEFILYNLCSEVLLLRDRQSNT
jgi:hypothetical protein